MHVGDASRRAFFLADLTFAARYLPRRPAKRLIGLDGFDDGHQLSLFRRILGAAHQLVRALHQHPLLLCVLGLGIARVLWRAVIVGMEKRPPTEPEIMEKPNAGDWAQNADNHRVCHRRLTFPYIVRPRS